MKSRIKHSLHRVKNSFYDSWALIFARPALQPFNKMMYNLALRGLGITNQHPRIAGEFRFIRESLRPLATARGDQAVFVDVGGNYGEYSTALRKNYPKSRIVAFEPQPNTFQTLQKKATQLNFEVRNLAIGSSPGTLELHDHEGMSGSGQASLYKEVFTQMHGETPKVYPVQVTTLDDMATELGIERITLLKLDIEGHELEALKGARRLLSENKIDCLQFEFEATNTVSRVFMHDFMALLPGFKFYRLLPGGFLPMTGYSPVYWEIFTFQNIIAVAPHIQVNGDKLSAK